MTVYMDGVVLLNFLVDFLLLLGAGRLCGYPAKMIRVLPAAAVGGLYAGACLLPGMVFLGNIFWRTVSLGVMSVIAYGFNRSAFRKGIVFGFLSCAMGGAALGIGMGGILGTIASAGVVFLLCCFGFRERVGETTCVPVELGYNGKRVHLMALRDTGNTLCDPITGGRVLVIGADAAQQLTGLTQAQLRQPVESVGVLPGLRLIPYRSVGNNAGFLLALKLQDVTIGTWQGSSLVAFAPERLHAEGSYQALTGGVI